MSERTRRYFQFAIAAVLARVTLGIGFPLLASLRYRNDGFREALTSTVRYLEPTWQAFELLPFLFLGAICASLARHSPRRAWGLFAAGLAAFSLIYYSGHMGAEAYGQRRAWTAASLAAGFVPMKCLGVAFLLLIVRLFMGRGHATGVESRRESA